MAKLDIFKIVADHFDDLGAKLTEAGYAASGVAAADVHDFFQDLFASGVDPEDLTSDQHEFARDVTNLMAAS
jgi:hypothetical protein